MKKNTEIAGLLSFLLKIAVLMLLLLYAVYEASTESSGSPDYTSSAEQPYLFR